MEIAVIAVIALIILGPQKLPEAARSLGKGFREMRDSFSGAADGSEPLDPYEEDDEFADEEDEETADDEIVDEDAPLGTSSEASETSDHQNEARSSVPSASSSSTERE